MIKRYKRLTYIFPNAIEVYEYLDGKYGARGAPRQKKRIITQEDIRKRNQWNKERKARNKLRSHFKENDYLITYTYRKSDRPPDMKVAKKEFAKAMRKIRQEYRKKGYEVKWIRNIEVGTKGAWHVHLIVNRIPDADLILKGAWPHGGMDIKLLYEKGGFAELAAYITKCPETDSRLKESSYSTSKNLPLTQPKEKKFVRWKREPKAKEGYYIDKETFYEGENKFTGYPYRYYTMVPIHRRN